MLKPVACSERNVPAPFAEYELDWHSWGVETDCYSNLLYIDVQSFPLVLLNSWEMGKSINHFVFMFIEQKEFCVENRWKTNPEKKMSICIIKGKKGTTQRARERSRALPEYKYYRFIGKRLFPSTPCFFFVSQKSSNYICVLCIEQYLMTFVTTISTHYGPSHLW